ncbi:hypothetical protein Ancab_027950 [Ancistrocladus abbreviatus]
MRPTATGPSCSPTGPTLLTPGSPLLSQLVPTSTKSEAVLVEKASFLNFILVIFTTGQSLSGVVGSPAYVAPEVLVGAYSEKVDVWSAGVLLHALLVGVLPFQGDSLEAVFEAIKNVKLELETGIWISVSQPARDLVARMLTRDVSARLSADEVLRHPWILFHTKPPLKMLTFKSKVRRSTRMTSPLLTAESRSESESNQKVDGGLLSDDSGLVLTLGSLCQSEEQDSEFVDALAVAISRINISEPKRMRLCHPTSSISQDCSSNLKANLCTAF